MAEAINHDGLSTVATMGDKAVKYGALGFLGALALPILTLGAVGAAVGMAVGISWGVGAALAAAGTGLVIGAVAGLAVSLVAAPVAAYFSTTVSGAFGLATVAGAAFGAVKAANQVGQESNAFRSRVEARMNGTQNKEAKLFNDGEVKGIDEGYQLAMQDMQAQIQQREAAAFQKGQETVVKQIQEHMQAEMAAAAAAQKPAHAPAAHAAAHAPATAHAPAEHGRKFAGNVIAKAECKVDAINQEREAKATNLSQAL